MQEEPAVKQTSVFWKIIRRFFLWTTISFFILAGTVVIIAYAYEDDAKLAVISELNRHLNAEIKVEPRNIDFTIIKSFPNAAVEFKDVMAYEALKKEKRDTLFTAGMISLQFNLLDIFNGNYRVKKIKLNDAVLNLKVDKHGKENYIFWKTDSVPGSAEQAAVSFRLEKIALKNIKVKYRNRQALIRVFSTIDEALISGEFSESNYSLKSEGKLVAEEFSIEKRELLKQKNLDYSFDIDVKGNKYVFKNADLAINKLSLSASGSLESSDSVMAADLNLKGKNIDVRSTLSLLPRVEQDKLKDYQSDGLFYVDAKLTGNLKRLSSLFIQAEFGIQNAVITYLPDGTKLEKVNLNGRYMKDNMHPEKLELKNISGLLKNEALNGNFSMTSFNDPYIELEAKGSILLEDLQRFYPIDTISAVSGGLKFNVYINGSVNELKNNFSEHNEHSHGEAEFTNVKLKFKHDEKEILIPSGKLSLRGSDIMAENIVMRSGKSDAVINGDLQNFIGWLLKDEQRLKVTAKLESKFISVDELLADPESGSGSSRPYELQVSDKIDLDLQLKVAETKLGKFEAGSIMGNLKVRDKKIFTENLSLETMDGDLTFTGII
ncbi:MAG: hypothetical protein ACJ76F_02985, partial [Bacteroidia bacterium]